MQKASKTLETIKRLETSDPQKLRQAISLFHSNIEFDPFGGCWLWSGKISTNGYGVLCIYEKKDGKPFLTYVRAHRFSYYLQTGVFPPDHLHACHRCDVPTCVNPAHLFLGSDKDNMVDCRQKGRMRYGTSPKLTPEIVRYIRSSTETPTKLAKQFGVGRRHVHKIRERITWANLA